MKYDGLPGPEIADKSIQKNLIDLFLRDIFVCNPVLFDVIRSVNSYKINDCYEDKSNEHVLSDIVDTLIQWKENGHARYV